MILKRKKKETNGESIIGQNLTNLRAHTPHSTSHWMCTYYITYKYLDVPIEHLRTILHWEGVEHQTIYNV